MKNFFATLAFIVTSGSAFGTSITFSAAPTSRSVNLEDGSAITVATAGSYIIGTFSSVSAASQVLAASQGSSVQDWYNNILASGAGWEQFGLDTSTNVANAGISSTLDFSILSSQARLGGTITDNNTGATKADFFNGKKVYVWAFNADTIGSATQMGIFEATAATVPWVFPTNLGGVGDTATFSSTVSGATIAAFGGVGSLSGSQLRLEAVTAVPEPSRAMLAAMGLFAGLVRRRRK